jgi:hypothetical protein
MIGWQGGIDRRPAHVSAARSHCRDSRVGLSGGLWRFFARRNAGRFAPRDGGIGGVANFAFDYRQPIDKLLDGAMDRLK